MSMRLTIFLVMLGLAAGATTASAQVAVIAHKDVPTDTLSKTDLLDFYTGDVQSWPGDLIVIVFDLKSRGPVRDAFYEYLGKTSSRMRSIWLKRKLSGEGDPPESFETEAAVLQRVASTPGAIGFVQKANVSGDAVKILVEIEIDEG